MDSNSNTQPQRDGPQPSAASAGSALTWYEYPKHIPPRNVVVMTKIDDEKGCRNETQLQQHGTLWFLPDMSMYVYYEPTHWRHLPNDKGQARGDPEHE